MNPMSFLLLSIIGYKHVVSLAVFKQGLKLCQLNFPATEHNMFTFMIFPYFQWLKLFI